MFAPLEQFVPSSVCLSCDGCCRFKEEQSSWRPKAAPEEKVRIQKSGLAGEILLKNPFLPDGSLKARRCHDSFGFQCSFLKAEDNTCRIYQSRPFDCQLYPFILTHDKNQLVICAHLNCPHVQHTRSTPVFKSYVGYLQNYFERPDVRDFLKKNPSLAGDYSSYRSELEVMFTVILE